MFSAQQGGSAVTQRLNVTGSSNGLAFNTSTSASWLKVSAASGTTPATLTGTVDPTGFSAGTVQQATLTITGFNSITIPVTLSITGTSGQTLVVDKTSLSFVGQVGGAATSPQSLTVSSGVSGQPFTVQSNASWLKVSPTSGNTPTTLNVTADPAGLGAGPVNGVLSISGGGNIIQVQVSFAVGSVGEVTPHP